MHTADPEFLIETDWLQAHLEDEDLIIIDCHYHLDFNNSGEAILTSGKTDWKRAHIPNSAYIDLLTELSDADNAAPFMMPSESQFSRVMSLNGIADNRQVVLYDRGESTWAARLWWMLRANGFDGARILNGGSHKWLAEKRPVATGTRAPDQSAPFICRPRPLLFVDKKDVLASLGNQSHIRICALDGGQYQRGHIPCSLNIPASGLIDSHNNTFLPPDRLAQIFEKAGLKKSDRIIAYCGGAIAGCCAAFALSMVGYTNVAVYDGSMEEWRKDTTLPLEVGNSPEASVGS